MDCKRRLADLRGVVVIPTYNNAGTVGVVVREVMRFADDVIVVNDGSTDDTQRVLDGIEGVRVISYERNRGKGCALKVGLKAAAEAGYRYAITIDADGQHYADDIPVFVDRIEEAPDSLLIGARNLEADNMPSKNTFANRFSNFWYRVETGGRLEDTQSGFRLYPLDKLQNIRFITTRYEFEVEIIVRAKWRGVNVENVPIKVYYPPEGERVSHFRPLRDFTRISVLNSVLVLYALLLYYPWKFLRMLTAENVRRFVDTQIIHSRESNVRVAAAMGWGVFCGIIPIWGYQMVFAGVSAHVMRLNKVIAIIFSNVSVPPMIPLILYGSMVTGAWLLGVDNAFEMGKVSFETVGVALGQYVAGSVALAVTAGAAVFVTALAVMRMCKRKVCRDE